MIYQGLKPECFYWEFVNIIRKVFLVSINVFLNLYPSIFKALVSLLVLVLLMRMQARINPYKNPVINELEARENLTTVITFFGALFFVTETSDVIQLIVFIIILIANIWFFGLWLYCLTKTLGFSITDRISRLLGVLVLSSNSKMQEA